MVSPVLLNLNKVAIGVEHGDLLDSIWGYWWFASELAGGSLIPHHAAGLYYPRGGDLIFPDPGNGVIASLLGAATIPVRAYNLVIICHFMLAGLGAYCLARRVGAGRYASLSAAGLLMTHSHLRALVAEGVPSATALGLIPLSLAFVDKALTDERPTSSIITAGLLMSATMLCGHYHGVQLLMLSLWLVGFRMSTNRHHLVLIKRYLAVGSLFLLISGPVQLAHLSVLAQGTELRMGSRFWNQPEPFDSTGLEFFVPLLETPAPVPRPSYLGLGLMVLAVGALIHSRRTRHWMIPASLLLVLSLGETWHWLLHRAIAAPWLYQAAAEIMPLSLLRNPFRFQAGAIIALLPMAAMSAQLVRRKLGRAGVWALTAALVADNLLFSGLGFRLPTTAIEIPEAYSLITPDPEVAAVLDLPVRFRFAEVGWYEVLQIAHGLAIPYNISEANDRTGVHQSILELPLIKAFNAQDPYFAAVPPNARYQLENEILAEAAEAARLPEEAISASIKTLRQLGYGYVVLHTQRLEPEIAHQFDRFLSAWLPKLTTQSAPALYEVPGL